MRNYQAVRAGTRSDSVFFAPELNQLLSCSKEWFQRTASEYRACSAAWGRLSSYRSASRETDGYAKSLDVAEGFAAWALIKQVRPRVVVELGSQYGISARLWKEALNRYVPGHTLILCDQEDQRRYIGPREAIFVEGDALRTLPGIFASYSVDLLFNDAHPYTLIRWSVEEAMRREVRVLAFHDVGRHHPRGPFIADSARLTEAQKIRESHNYGECGTWERHVAAELLDKSLLSQDSAETTQYRMQVFDSLFGFLVAIRIDRSGSK